MIKIEENQKNLKNIVHEREDKLATLNLAPGNKVYDEHFIEIEGKEYRIWDPFRSKLAAALLKNLKNLPIIEGSQVLYLGVSTGTTASHISDIIGEKGTLFAVEIAPRVAREFIERVALKRKNVIPIVEDAHNPDAYTSVFSKVDVIYCDIAQPDQTNIAILNCKRYLKKGGKILLIIKARSIDTTQNPEKIFKQEASKLENEGFIVTQIIRLDPFDRDHAIINATL